MTASQPDTALLPFAAASITSVLPISSARVISPSALCPAVPARHGMFKSFQLSMQDLKLQKEAVAQGWAGGKPAFPAQGTEWRAADPPPPPQGVPLGGH